MVRMSSICVSACLIALPIFSASAQVNQTTLTFSNPDFEWYQSSGNYLTLNHLWEIGDYWVQNFQGTDLPSANTMSLTLSFDDNALDSGSVLYLEVLLNNSPIGNFSISPDTLGLQQYQFSFDPIPGPDYRIKIQVVGRDYAGGCAAITIDGPSFGVLSGS